VLSGFSSRFPSEGEGRSYLSCWLSKEKLAKAVTDRRRLYDASFRFVWEESLCPQKERENPGRQFHLVGVMRWLGHRDSAMVRHYYHLHDDEAQRQMKRLQFFGDAGSGGVAGQVP
jgi:hypothetical protein